jgi:hypothetical protein
LQTLLDDRVKHHHVFKNSGWISFYIENEADAAYAVELLKLAYEKCKIKERANPHLA